MLIKVWHDTKNGPTPYQKKDLMPQKYNSKRSVTWWLLIMVVLIVTSDSMSNLVEESRKATPTTIGMTTHVDRDVLIPSVRNWHCQLHQRLLHQIQSSFIITNGAVQAHNWMRCTPPCKWGHPGWSPRHSICTKQQRSCQTPKNIINHENLKNITTKRRDNMFLTQSWVPVFTLRQAQVRIIEEINFLVSIIINNQHIMIKTTEKILREVGLPSPPAVRAYSTISAW